MNLLLGGDYRSSVYYDYFVTFNVFDAGKLTLDTLNGSDTF